MPNAGFIQSAYLFGITGFYTKVFLKQNIYNALLGTKTILMFTFAREQTTLSTLGLTILFYFACCCICIASSILHFYERLLVVIFNRSIL